MNWEGKRGQRIPQEIQQVPQREEDRLREKCAVFAVFSEKKSAAPFVYIGLSALQHRGQETTGITSSDTSRLITRKGAGLVSAVYSSSDLENLSGNIAIGHNRYSTSGSSEKHLQPITTEKNLVSLAHNGTLPETKKLEAFLTDHHVEIEGINDSELMQRAVEFYVEQGHSLPDAMKAAYPLFTGAFAVVAMTKDTLVGIRDSKGVRPLSIGQTADGEYALSSETYGLDSIEAEHKGDVQPGEMVVITKDGLERQQLAEGEEKLDIFEIVYFSRPESVFFGKRVNDMRRAMGKQLAEETPQLREKADMVFAVPNSSIPAAAGFAEASGIPYEPDALIKDAYVHRTFINPDGMARVDGVRRKFSPIREVLQNKRVVVVDDSIVRGTTLKELVTMIREAGAKEVHIVISAPPVKYPDFYGIATPSQEELIASHMSAEEIRQFIGADTLHYLSYEGMLKAIDIPEEKLNTSCFTGIYPIDIGENAKDIDFTV